MIEAAGDNVKKGFGGTVGGCLFMEKRPITPPEIRKYRRSANLEPGKRFEHHGLADDYKTMNLTDRIYGGREEVAQIHASDLLSHKKLSELQKIDLAKAESTYKGLTREPLGATYDRKVKLPSKFAQGCPFGQASKSSAEAAKDIIFPQLTEDTAAGEELYKISHKTWGTGVQITRKYDWNIDPATVRFGRKGDTIALNGVSKNIHEVLQGTSDNQPSTINGKRVEDFRNKSDMLGQSKNLGQNSGARPFDQVYGKSVANSKGGKGQWGAADVIKGKYTVNQQQPDIDLGKSITPGFRNISLENRAYGCPSIRTDLPNAGNTRRSLADSQNYGDDVPAQDLINPPAFSDLSIPSDAMSGLRTKDKLIELFSKIGFDVDPEISDIIFNEASGGGDQASINTYRSALNHYLVCCELGDEADWFAQRGYSY